MIKYVEYLPEHLEKIQPKSLHAEKPKEIKTRAITFLVEDQPIAIFGGFFFAPGVSHIWGLVSDEVVKYPLDLFESP